MNRNINCQTTVGNFYYTPRCCPDKEIITQNEVEKYNMDFSPEWCDLGNGKLKLEENKYYKIFINDSRFSLFHNKDMDLEDINAINNSLWTAERNINYQEVNSYQEAILYYAAHLLYTSFVVAESEAISSFKLASSDIRGNELKKSTIYRIVGKDETWDSMGLLNSPFGMHLRSIIQASSVGFVTL